MKKLSVCDRHSGQAKKKSARGKAGDVSKDLITVGVLWVVTREDKWSKILELRLGLTDLVLAEVSWEDEETVISFPNTDKKDIQVVSVEEGKKKVLDLLRK